MPHLLKHPSDPVIICQVRISRPVQHPLIVAPRTFPNSFTADGKLTAADVSNMRWDLAEWDVE